MMGHYAELMADSRGGGRRGRSRRVVRGGCCLQKALMVEQPSQMFGSQGEVRVRRKCQSFPTMLMMLLMMMLLLLSCQLPPGTPGEAMWTL